MTKESNDFLLEYRKERKRVTNMLGRLRRRGYDVSGIRLPSIPKNPTAKSVERLRRMTTAKAYEKTKYVSEGRVRRGKMPRGLVPDRVDAMPQAARDGGEGEASNASKAGGQGVAGRKMRERKHNRIVRMNASRGTHKSRGLSEAGADGAGGDAGIERQDGEGGRRRKGKPKARKPKAKKPKAKKPKAKRPRGGEKEKPREKAGPGARRAKKSESPKAPREDDWTETPNEEAPDESDVIIGNLDGFIDSLDLGSPEAVDYVKGLFDEYIDEFGKEQVAENVKTNASLISRLVNIILTDSDEERRVQALEELTRVVSGGKALSAEQLGKIESFDYGFPGPEFQAPERERAKGEEMARPVDHTSSEAVNAMKRRLSTLEAVIKRKGEWSEDVSNAMDGVYGALDVEMEINGAEAVADALERNSIAIDALVIEAKEAAHTESDLVELLQELGTMMY